MAQAKTCQDEARAVERAKDKKSDQRAFSSARRDAKADLNRAKDKLKACEKSNSSDRAIIMARGMARAAHDAGVQFPLKKDWHKSAGIGKKDNVIEAKLKLKNVEDAVEYVNKFADRNDLKQAAGNAVALEALYDLKGRVSGGFISAQIAIGIMDIVATVLSLGTYAAFAPAIHTAVGAGKKVSLDLIQKDISAAEAKYANALTMRQDRISAKKASAPVAPPAEPKKKGMGKKGLVIGGVAVAGLAALSAVLGR